jgi:uncharacterized protein YaaR (DUF327 family)
LIQRIDTGEIQKEHSSLLKSGSFYKNGRLQQLIFSVVGIVAKRLNQQFFSLTEQLLSQQKSGIGIVGLGISGVCGDKVFKILFS